MPSTLFAYPQVVSRTFASFRVLNVGVSAGQRDFGGGFDSRQLHQKGRNSGALFVWLLRHISTPPLISNTACLPSQIVPSQIRAAAVTANAYTKRSIGGRAASREFRRRRNVLVCSDPHTLLVTFGTSNRYSVVSGSTTSMSPVSTS